MSKKQPRLLDHNLPNQKLAVIHPDIVPEPSSLPPAEALIEAVALAEALPAVEIAYSAAITVKNPKPNTLIGGGQVEEIAEVVKAEEIAAVVIDHGLTPTQQRNLEVALECKVIDRTGLILEIFATRAKSRAGKLQVNLAQLKYQQSRLVRAWSHLERQRGGMSKTGGPGERQLELDKRMLADQIGRLEKQLAKVQRDRRLNRQQRADNALPTIALVGYTNAGKSTLFRTLTAESKTYVADQLFATLDPLSRQVKLPSGQTVVLTDTVGFIRDLPHQLVAAFAATLEEVATADLILLVRDAADPNKDAQAAAVKDVLSSIDAAEVPSLIVWNKADLVAADDLPSGGIAISAETGSGLPELLNIISDTLKAQLDEYELELPLSAGKQLAWLQAQGAVEDMRTTDDAYIVTVRLSSADLARLRRMA